MELFVFDIDGTLVSKFGEMTEETKYALDALLKRGDCVCLASGRCHSGVMHYLADLIPSNGKYCVSSNGSRVVDQNGNMLYRRTISYSDFLRIRNKYETDKSVAYFYVGDDIGTFNPDADICKMEYECNRMNQMIDLNSTSLPMDFSIDKVIIAAMPEDSLKIEAMIEEEDKQMYHVVRSSDIFIEFVERNVDKSTGISELARHLGIERGHIHTFGDSMNDYQMIKDFDGTAMGNALEPVRQVAKRVTTSCEEDGVAHALKNWFGVE